MLLAISDDCCWQSVMFFVMLRMGTNGVRSRWYVRLGGCLLDLMWGSAFEPMPGDCVESGVDWLGLMVVDVAEIQLIAFA